MTLFRRVSLLTILASLLGSSIWLAPAATARDISEEQWYLGPMKAEEMWEVSTGEGVTVAVIDSGVKSSATLNGRLLPGEDLTDLPGDATDDYLPHGTSVAEVIAGTGKNGGVQGIAPGVKILPLRVKLATDEDDGWEDSGETSLEDAIRVAADSDARILNMSIGSVPTQALESAVDYAVSKGKLIFASTGNNGDEGNQPIFPASYANVVAVGAVNKNNRVAEYSQYGQTDLTAPGSDIPVWCDKDFTSYCMGDGTSIATAVASGSAALIWAEHPDWTANQVLRVMMETASKPADGSDYSTKLGYGTVRPRKVLLDGEGDPGDPNQHPLLKEEASPSPSAPTSAPPEEKPADNDDSKSDWVEVAEEDDGDDGPSTGLLIGGAVAAVLVVAAGVGFLVLRRR
ncbi:S8 family serine peptidase [Streptomyces sp. WMMC1477]|uniref:S8 family serine peptidase n=1 Tax=Streptomyces sp. WMMC1477 TaxID=3015155 RepID=UPI0022B73AD0|nr:S8 family serine peptidase [Streptomyces sp. WMMC1477]MCZ7433999.1 S8 family serine peptidase [Streptomyces sp. WMMC1477]